MRASKSDCIAARVKLSYVRTMYLSIVMGTGYNMCPVTDCVSNDVIKHISDNAYVTRMYHYCNNEDANPCAGRNTIEGLTLVEGD